jgi:DNA-binding LacI/PurR family transcriptional regulator
MAVKLVDIATQANVSPAIVSRVLNNKPGVWASEETRQRILDVARELKYRPSAAGRALVTGRTMQIAVSASDHDWVHGRGGRMLHMRGLIDAASENNYSILVVPSPGQHAERQQFEEWVEGGKCDGFCVFAEQCSSDIYDYFREQSFRYIVIGNANAGDIPQVDHDNYHYIYDAVEWLASQGHQRISFVLPTPASEILPPHVRVMQRAFRDAQETLFGAYDPSLLLRSSSEEDVILDFLRTASPSAVILYGNARTIRWRTLFMKHGIKTPEDITLLAHLDMSGLYDVERAYLAEGLAFQVYDPRLIGWTAGNTLIQWIQGTAPASAPLLIPSQKPAWWTQPLCVAPEYL